MYAVEAVTRTHVTGEFKRCAMTSILVVDANSTVVVVLQRERGSPKSKAILHPADGSSAYSSPVHKALT